MQIGFNQLSFFATFKIHIVTSKCRQTTYKDYTKLSSNVNELNHVDISTFIINYSICSINIYNFKLKQIHYYLTNLHLLKLNYDFKQFYKLNSTLNKLVITEKLTKAWFDTKNFKK